MSYLSDCGRDFDPSVNLLAQPFKSPGYHTRIADGRTVHATVPSLRYALALLKAGCECERAFAVLRAILALQDTDFASPTYGIWPWIFEEPLAAMALPDWNWADFCGELLALALADHAAVLSAGLAAEMRASLGHAAWAIFRRNCAPGYTNIAVLGGVVVGAAGELLGEPRLTAYAKARFARLLSEVERHGDFNEYNSPPYLMVALRATETGLHLVCDSALRVALENVRRLVWRTIADYYHPATDQWAGPHSRTYADLLAGGVTALLGDRLGGPRTAAQDGNDFAPTVACPAEFRDRFKRLPEREEMLRRQYVADTERTFAIAGATWFCEGACIGSISRDSFWIQRRPLIAYWRLPDGGCAVFRSRLLKNGRDFAGAGLVSTQDGPRVAGGLCAFLNLGDFHLHQDRPPGGRYSIQDLRLRFQLAAPGASVVRHGETSFELTAGGWRIALRLAGIDRIEIGENGETVWVDACLHSGPVRDFEPAALPVGAVRFSLGLGGLCDVPVWTPLPNGQTEAEIVSYPVFYWQPNS